MRKSILFVALFISIGLYPALAQDAAPVDSAAGQTLADTAWTTEFSAGLNFNQAAFSGNWKNGGINSVAFGSIIAGKANYAKDRLTWDNEMELLFGIVSNEGERSRKSNDRIFLDTKVGYKMSGNWSTYFSLNFLSQFAKGYNYENDSSTLISNFLAPGYLTSSLGFEYKPNQEFALRLSPFSPRFTFVTDRNLYLTVPENYGVPIGKSIRTEWLALQVYATWDKNLTENLNLKSRYQLFANYETLDWKTIDHRLDITLTAKITNLINVTLTSINLYDIDQDPGIQYSQTLALGILYKVSNKN
jgi:hypothetical protein